MQPDADGTWSYVFGDVYKNAKGKNGVPAVYTLEQEEVKGYETVIEENADGGFDITNTHETEKLDVTVYKTWEDEDDIDGLRPESIVLHLHADDEPAGDITLTAPEEGGNFWSGTLEGLNRYAYGGREISYTVTEDEVPGYETVINGLDVTNIHVHEREKIAVTGSILWDDDSNRDGIRPGSVTVRLYADGEEADYADVTEDADGSWTYSFEDLDKFNGGEEIVYTVLQDDVDEYSCKSGEQRTVPDHQRRYHLGGREQQGQHKTRQGDRKDLPRRAGCSGNRRQTGSLRKMAVRIRQSADLQRHRRFETEAAVHTVPADGGRLCMDDRVREPEYRGRYSGNDDKDHGYP